MRGQMFKYKKHHYFRRLCDRCGNLFVPTGKACRICEGCKIPQIKLYKNKFK